MIAGLLLLFPCFANDVVRIPVKKKGAGPLFQIHYGVQWGFMNRTGRTVIKPRFDDEGDFFEGLAKVRIGDWKWGYIDQTGHVAIAAQFDDAGDFSEGLAPVRLGHKWGFIDHAGKFVIPPQFQAAAEFHEGLALIEVWTRYSYEGKTLSEDDAPRWAWRLHNHPPLGTGYGGPLDDRYGYVDLDGNIVIPPTFKDAQDFSNGRARIHVDGKEGYIDNTGRTVIAPQFDQAEQFSEGFAAVEVGTRAVGTRLVGARWGFIDTSGAFVILPGFADVMSFSEGLAAVSLPGQRYGYIDKTGKFILPPIYDDAHQFSCGLALVTSDDEEDEYYIDKSGRKAFVSKLPAEWWFSDGLTVSDDKYIDRRGRIVAPYEIGPHLMQPRPQ